MAKEEKFCPFLLGDPKTCAICLRGKCAWWCDEAKECSVHALVHKGLEEEE